jgi:arsenite-transporting ATPase
VLFTGKGGVGKTTLAAATAARVASEGRKTLVLSTDPAHSLADALACGVEAEPTEVASGLYVGHVDTQRRLQDSWGELQGYLASLLGSAGFDSLRAEELTVLPGAEELLALIEVRDHVRSGRWDAVIVDCAPTAETLRLLALPEALDWYLTKALPAERRVVRALRPLLGPAVGLPAPNTEVWEAAERLQAQLLDVQQVLRAPETTVRLVLTPESVVVAEARRALTQLALYGYRVDGVIANRVFDAGDDPWRSGWAQAQRRQLAEVTDSFEPLPVFTAGYLSAEPVGPEALAALGATVYGQADPLAAVESADFLAVRQVGHAYVMTLTLPLVDRDSLDLTRVGDDLVVTVSGRRRVLALPSALKRCQVRGAHVEDGRLEIRFSPNPDRFPRVTEAHP